MKMSIRTAEHYFYVDRLIIHSLDMCLYQASVELEQEQWLLTDEQQRPLRTHSLIEMHKLVSKIQPKQTVLRQQSAYDEMVGGPEKVDNTLEVILHDQQLY